jgi:hypothetical protein
MYALLLATFCLLSARAFPVWADSDLPAGPALEVYVKNQQASSPAVLAEMNRELGAQMRSAGFRVIVRGANDPPSSAGAEHLVIVELRGACVARRSGMRSKRLSYSLPLASSSVADGRVLPFSWVNCSVLNRFLEPVIGNQPDAERAHLYGRSMARLLAHEFYHVLAQTYDHTDTGIAKERFSTADLLAEHFEFESGALDRLRPAPPPREIAADDSPVSTGR